MGAIPFDLGHGFLLILPPIVGRAEPSDAAELEADDDEANVADEPNDELMAGLAVEPKPKPPPDAKAGAELAAGCEDCEGCKADASAACLLFSFSTIKLEYDHLTKGSARVMGEQSNQSHCDQRSEEGLGTAYALLFAVALEVQLHSRNHHRRRSRKESVGQAKSGAVEVSRLRLGGVLGELVAVQKGRNP